uniref:NADH dehydrogenase subunit 1 n=1 Tax=Pillucina pisidium (Dunker, 1860) TaxID=244488 RepID=UPI00233EB69A|nr:NADH dehydrogenase subunit 1 [Pillucina pisidium (Dunker, 1860)]WBR65416.1 NADH dehydrogenase subunit 1 [Pillucina pisidium (Dunker, 1860)]
MLGVALSVVVVTLMIWYGFVSFVVTFLVVMGGVAFFTLLERKFLGYFQMRLGPNKVGYKGVPQPIADAMKLFLKEFLLPHSSNKFAFMVGPSLMLVLCIGVWVLYPVLFSSVYYLWSFLLFVCISSSGVYGVIAVGWASNSKYAYLGCVRAVAQFISYEVVMVMIILVSMLCIESFSMGVFNKVGLWGFFVFTPMFFMWALSLLAETNRAPFDFVEGESELVSGFNVEYGGVGFAMIFIAEYSMILFMGVMTGVIYFGGVGSGVFFSVMLVLGMSSFVVLCRGGLPRFRYDLLMMLTWKYLLPIVLVFLGVSFIMLK